MRNTRITPISLTPERFEMLEEQRKRKTRSAYIAELLEKASPQPAKVGEMPATPSQ